MFVVTGPIYQDPGGQERVIEAEGNPCRNEIRLPPLAKTSICDANDDDDASCANGVAVPSALYKIIYDPGNQRVNAYVLPNLNHTPLKQSMKTREYLNRHRASVALVEEYTGFDFLTALSRRDQSVIEESCPATFFH
jgi:endonuclease G, mitochondrial